MRLQPDLSLPPDRSHRRGREEVGRVRGLPPREVRDSAIRPHPAVSLPGKPGDAHDDVAVARTCAIGPSGPDRQPARAREGLRPYGERNFPLRESAAARQVAAVQVIPESSRVTPEFVRSEGHASRRPAPRRVPRKGPWSGMPGSHDAFASEVLSKPAAMKSGDTCPCGSTVATVAGSATSWR